MKQTLNYTYYISLVLMLRVSFSSVSGLGPHLIVDATCVGAARGIYSQPLPVASLFRSLHGGVPSDAYSCEVRVGALGISGVCWRTQPYIACLADLGASQHKLLRCRPGPRPSARLFLCAFSSAIHVMVVRAGLALAVRHRHYLQRGLGAALRLFRHWCASPFCGGCGCWASEPNLTDDMLHSLSWLRENTADVCMLSNVVIALPSTPRAELAQRPQTRKAIT